MTGDITIRYKDRHLPLRLPAGTRVDVVGRRAGAGAPPNRILAEAIDAPVAAPRFADFLRGAQSPLVIVNDGTRSTPTALILLALWREIAQTSGWRVIVATGLHRGPTEGEARSMFGDLYDQVRPRLLVHDGYDDSALVPLDPAGKTLVNRAVGQADRLVVLTSVEPHFFAGYTGGRKSIIPGLAGRSTVEASHAGAVSPNAAALRVDGNPVREFIHAETQYISATRFWAVQAVLDREDRIAAAFAGDIDSTFRRACAAAADYYVIPLDRTYDIVLSVVHPPLDLNLYQTMKGWDLSQEGVRDGGVLIVISPCVEGVGASFYTDLVERYPDPTQWHRLEDRPYSMGLHKLVRTARARARYRLLAVTDMPAAEVARYGYEAFENLDAALSVALDHVGTAPSVLVVEDSALTTVRRWPR